MQTAIVGNPRSTARAGSAEPLAQCMSSAECGLALLERSIAFGHGRLAVLRLAVAIDIGAEIPIQSWAYCARVAKDSADPDLQSIYRYASAKVEHAVPPLD
jgi:hypothetical protein